MEEKLLKETLDKFNFTSQNTYPKNTTTDLLKITERELTELGIRYNKKQKRKRRAGRIQYYLNLFDQEHSLMNYHKGFYPNNTDLGRLISNDKILSERFLKFSDVKTPDTKVFNEKEFNEAYDFISQNDSSIFVLKPKDLSHARGVFININKTNFENSWKSSLKVQKEFKVANPAFIIQKKVSGLELRITIVEGIVNSVIFRAPGHVIGDGNSTIEELIHVKNKERELNPFHRKNSIQINEELNDNLRFTNNSLDTVLPKNELCILYTHSSVAEGRENYEITDHISPGILQQAKEAVLAIPGVSTAGVDIIVDDISAETGTVIEVNQRPNFQMNYFPMYGQPQTPLKQLFYITRLERRIRDNRLELNSLSVEDFNILNERFKFVKDKIKVSDESIKNLM